MMPNQEFRNYLAAGIVCQTMWLGTDVMATQSNDDDETIHPVSNDDYRAEE